MLNKGFSQSSIEYKTIYQELNSQLRILLWKNYMLQRRYYIGTIMKTIGAPFLFMLVLFCLQQADYAQQRTTILSPPKAPLKGGAKPCIDVMYYPDTEKVRSYLRVFANINANRTKEPKMEFDGSVSSSDDAPKKKLGLVAVPNPLFIYNYVVQNQNTTNWGIVFSNTTDPVPNIQYQIWYNSSRISDQDDIFSLEISSFMRGIDEAICTIVLTIVSIENDPSGTKYAELDISVKDWPVVPPAVLSDTVVQNLGPLFFFCSVMVIFLSTLETILVEKEKKQRYGMEMMGLKPFIYWLGNFISFSGEALLASLSTTIFGLMFGFESFRKTDFFALILTFFLFGEAMIVFAFFISTFISKARVANMVGIFVFIVGIMFQSFVFSASVFGYIWWKDKVPNAFAGLFSLLPFFNFGKLFLDISTLTTGRPSAITGIFSKGPGASFDNLLRSMSSELLPFYSDGTTPNPPKPILAILNLLWNTGLYWVLTLYLDLVIPNDYGNMLPPWFFLTISYWRGESNTMDYRRWREYNSKYEKPIPENLNDAVIEERIQSLSQNNHAVKVMHLRKEYRTIFGSLTKVSIKDMCISLRQGELFALLGQNGAGKTTTINVLSGLVNPTHGDALMFGYSRKKQMHIIRKIMGICPQYDVLYDDLTAREHIYLFAGIKGIPKNQWDSLLQERLDAVKLLAVADCRVGTYSGGMKRRLSVMLATIGDPQITFLDEPTTGMDPINRRHVWNFIEKFKIGRVVVLTTHSMEEAEVLGDRIGIMAHGRLRAIGSPAMLKHRYSLGYKFSIITEPYLVDAVKQEIETKVPGIILEDDGAGSLIYQFPETHTNYIPEFIEFLDENAQGHFKAWGMSETSLEQIFLRIVRANQEPNIIYGED